MIMNRILYADVRLIDLMIGIMIIVFGVLTAKIIALYTKKLVRDKVKRQYQDLMIKIVYYFLIVVVLITALPMLGVKLSGLLVAGGILGIALGFASQSIVSNLISGLFLLLERPINIGNPVNIDGTIGIVEDIQIISTTLRTFDGLYVRIPNQKVFTANITNFEANVARRFEYVIGIRYRDDADKAIDIIKSVVEKEPMALKNPKPLVFVSELGESSVNLVIRAWAPVPEWYSLYTKLLWKLKTALEADGIEIPFPQRVLWQGETPLDRGENIPNPSGG